MSKDAAAITPDTIKKLEEEAKETAKLAAEGLQNFSGIAEKVFRDYLRTKGIGSQDKHDAIEDLFKATALQASRNASKSLFNGLKRGEGLLFNGLLASGAVTVLDGILSFRKKAEELFPGLIDTILDAADFAITGLLAACAPPVALVLRATGIMTQIKDFVSIDTLSETSKQLHKKMDELGEDKKLKRMSSTFEAIKGLCEKEVDKIATTTAPAVVAAMKNAAAEGLLRFGLDHNKLHDLQEAIDKNDTVKNLVYKMSQAAQKIPMFQSEAHKTMETLGKELTELTKDTLPSFQVKILQDALNVAREHMVNTTKSENIIHKLALAAAASQALEEVGKAINDPDKKKAFQEKIREHLCYGAQEAVEQARDKTNSEVQKFIKETLGMTKSVEARIDKIQTNGKAR